MSVLHRAPDHPAQDVPPPLVRGQDAVGDQERGRARVIRDHPVDADDLRVVSVGRAGMLLRPRDQAADVVDVEVRVDVLQERRRSFEPEPGVDVLVRQLGERAVLREVELHEDEVPELEVAVAFATRSAGGKAAAVRFAAVEEQLRVRPAGAGLRRLPEVLGARERDDPFARDADPKPAATAASSRSSPSSGSPAKTVAQTLSSGKPRCSRTNSHARSIAPSLK